MTSFPVPTRAAFECADGRRVGIYVMSVEPDCVWINLGAPVVLPAGTRVRLTFRVDGGSSLGLGGIIVVGDHETVGVQVRGPIDRAILAAWSEGESADISPSQRIFNSETPTADVSLRIPSQGTEVVKPRRRKKHDTLEDFVLRQSRI